MQPSCGKKRLHLAFITSCWPKLCIPIAWRQRRSSESERVQSEFENQHVVKHILCAWTCGEHVQNVVVWDQGVRTPILHPPICEFICLLSICTGTAGRRDCIWHSSLLAGQNYASQSPGDKEEVLKASVCSLNLRTNMSNDNHDYTIIFIHNHLVNTMLYI